MNYEILTAGTPAELAEKVNAKLAEGFEPLGGPFVTWKLDAIVNGPMWVVAQAMRRTLVYTVSNLGVKYYPENDSQTTVYPQRERTIPPKSTAG